MMHVFFRHAGKSAVSGSVGKRIRSSITDLICKDRYQISFGIVLAVCIPIIVRGLFFTDINLTDPNQYNTVTATTLAIVMGYLSFKKIHVFPGITSGGYIATSLTLWFAVLTAFFLFLRLEYTTIQLFAGYIISIFYFTTVHLYFVNRRGIVLGVVPSAATARLPSLRRINWFQLTRADTVSPKLTGVVADLTADHSDEWRNRIAQFVLEGVPVYHVKDAIENLIGQVEIEHLSENMLGSLNPNDIYLTLKGLVDRCAALVGLLFLAPLLVVIAIAIKLDSPGPVLFRQPRVGFRKRSFTVHKFRTMKHGGNGGSDRSGAITRDNDPRITRVGAVLRKYRLDELPQLIDVCRGRMSLIGPRPEALALAEWYEKEIPFYHYRHIIKPGITGWAQVNQGHVFEVSDVTRKLHLDFYYVKNFSFWLDVYIVLKTLRVMMWGHGAR